MLTRLAEHENRKRRALSHARLVADPARCIQCGICSYNCPAGVDIRGHVWCEEPINDCRCVICGECVARCPRGALRFVSLAIAS
jgi:ferredoxin